MLTQVVRMNVDLWAFLETAEPNKNIGPAADAHAPLRCLRLLDDKLHRTNLGLRDPHRHHPPSLPLPERLVRWEGAEC